MDKTEMRKRIRTRGWCTPREAFEAVFEGWENPTEADFNDALTVTTEWFAKTYAEPAGRQLSKIAHTAPGEMEKAQAAIAEEAANLWKDAFEYLASRGSTMGKDALSKFPS